MSDSLLKPSETAPLTPEMRAQEPVVPQRNFWLALAAQFLLLAAIPAPTIYTLNTGTTVFLQTAPVDPYDILRGYYQTLGYDIADRAMLAKLPGGEILKEPKSGSREIFVTLELPPAGRKAAKPIAIARQRPTNLPSNQIAIRGIISNWQIRYQIEKFYLPETEQQNVNQNIDRNRRNLLVEVKIDSTGHPVPVSLWVGQKSYSF
jgi:uncharacterized membrane-anchored protein